MKIFHLISKENWEKVRNLNDYKPESFEKEKFIHCSQEQQYIKVADIKFKGRKDLLLLEIDADKVRSPIKHERLAGMKEEHPHIYGTLNLDAVNKIYKLTPDANGFFTYPKKMVYPPYNFPL